MAVSRILPIPTEFSSVIQGSISNSAFRNSSWFKELESCSLTSFSGCLSPSSLLSWQELCWCWLLCCRWSPYCCSAPSLPAPGRATPLSAESWVRRAGCSQGRGWPSIPTWMGEGIWRDYSATPVPTHLPLHDLKTPNAYPQQRHRLPPALHSKARDKGNDNLFLLGSRGGQQHIVVGCGDRKPARGPTPISFSLQDPCSRGIQR